MKTLSKSFVILFLAFTATLTQAQMVEVIIPTDAAAWDRGSGSADGTGDGGLLQTTELTLGLTKPDVDDPSTWHSTRAWVNDHQGRNVYEMVNDKANNPWYVFDLGASYSTLDKMFIINVSESAGWQRGIKNIEIYYTDDPGANTVPVWAGSGNLSSGSGNLKTYDFSAGGWTQLGGTHTIDRGAENELGSGMNPYDLAVDISTIPSARYIGIRALSSYFDDGGANPFGTATGSSSANRAGICQIAFTQNRPLDDTDLDGMDDDWELLYFGDLSRDGTGDYDLDDITDLDEFLAGSNPTVMNVGYLGEAGRISISQSGIGQWHTVQLSQSYTDPVVVAGPPSYIGYGPGVIRVRNVQSDSFEIQLAEFEYDDGVHPSETVSYLVIESGQHALPGGTVVQAGHTTVAGGADTALTYATAFAGTPALLTQITTQNDARVAVVRQDQNSTTGSALRLYNSEAEETISAHGSETVAWIAWSTGNVKSPTGAYVAESSPQDLSTSFKSYTFPFNHFAANSNLAVIGSIGSTVDTDTVSMRYQSMDAAEVKLRLQEEKSADTEEAHANEVANYLVIETGFIGIRATTGDVNADGLPDQWQIDYGLIDSQTLAPLGGLSFFDAGMNGDPDLDGATNFEEYAVTGTDPLEVGAFPGIFNYSRWNSIVGLQVSDIFNFDAFYQQPDVESQMTAIEGPNNAGNGYASRLRGSVIIPDGGQWRFYLSADDGAKLWISPTGNKFLKQKVAEISPALTGGGTGGTGYRSWHEIVSQRTEWMDLVAGQEVFIEVLHIDGGQNDHVSVAWERLGGNPGLEVVSGADVLLSYKPGDNDADDDYLPDDWEATYGLSTTDNGLIDRNREGERGDFDSDGLTNHEEYILGTNPANRDTDGDGYDDGREVNSLGTNPLVADIIAATPVATHTGDTLTGSSADWFDLSDGGVILADRRGWVDYSFTTTEDGVWRYQMDIRPHGTYSVTETLNVRLSIDGISMGTRQVVSVDGEIVMVDGITPYLLAGTHTVRLFHDNLLGRVSLRIDEMRITKPDGIDADTNGIVDSIETLLAVDSDLVIPAATSITSPVTVEGRQRHLGNVSLDVNGQPFAAVNQGPDDIWFADVPLDPTGTPVAIDASFEGGTRAESASVSWVTTNAYAGDPMTIRTGDSLLLDVMPAGTPDPDASVVVDIAATGRLLMERWEGIPGSAVNDLTSDPNYPDQPDSTSFLAGAETPGNTGSDYGLRLRGYLTAPESGDYTFYVASDNSSEFWLSTDRSADNKVKVAYLDGHTTSWTQYPSQSSDPITLVAGEVYYLEALFKEGTGSDFFRIGWQTPSGGSIEVIPASDLSASLMNVIVAEDDIVVAEFPDLGGYTATLTATHTSGTSVVTVGTTTVNVLAGDFGETFDARVNYLYDWSIPGISNFVELQPGEDVDLSEVDSVNGVRTFEVGTEVAGTHYLLARMPGAGSIIGRGELNATLLAGLNATQDFQTEYVYEDGTKVISYGLIVDNLPEGGSVTINISKAGITFLDGSSVKILTANDIDDSGVIRVTMVIDPTAGQAFCHTITIRDANGNAF